MCHMDGRYILLEKQFQNDDMIGIQGEDGSQSVRV